MANTYTRLLFHCVWSTKDRHPLINPRWESRLWAYLAAIAKDNEIHALRIGGIEDHIHALLDLPKTFTISQGMQQLKGNSSSWVNDQKLLSAHFAWQDGYSAFSVSPSQVPKVVAYIANQRAHHRTQSFEDEYRALLDHHGIAFDERYTFG